MPRVPVVVAPVKDVSHLWLPQNAATGDLDRVALGDGTITGTDAFDDFGRYFDGSSNYLSWDSAGSVGPWLGDGQSYSAFAI
ncbi:MAG: hypothetical protein KJO91_03090, partial [Gammaproteobacteria bacterium]|nr:hypothetical protein [Gammaproteobacteria bacterium]